MTEAPTPFDIIDPARGAILLPDIAWYLLFGSFLIVFITIWLMNRKLSKPKSHFSLPPIVNDLQELLSRYEKTSERKALHQFVKLAKRHANTNDPLPLNPFIEAIEKERFAPSITPDVQSAMREVISIIAVGKSERGGEQHVS